MSGERKAIRDWAFELLIDQFGLPVKKQRKIEVEDDQFFNVYVPNKVTFEENGLQYFCVAQLVIGFHIADFDDDDQLEIMSDQITELILGSRLPEGISGIRPLEIDDNGDETERAVNSVYVSFSVIY